MARGAGGGAAAGGDDVLPGRLKFKSPAEFFSQNKNIAGFDNPGKSLYTTIRELVENGLDAAEQIAQLPSVSVSVVELTRQQLNQRIGLENRERVDQSLYADVLEARKSAVKASKKRARSTLVEASAGSKRAKSEAGGVVDVSARGDNGNVDDDGVAAPASQPDLESSQRGQAAVSASQSTPVKDRRGAMFYEVCVRDNGVGMPHQMIPDMLGRVLAGTKYGVKQTRGKFGLGAKMALLWSKMSSGLPIDVRSARIGHKISHYILDIDVHRNVPNVKLVEQLDNPDGWHGTEIRVTSEGNWTTYRAKILSYMRQMAVITPYAEFTFRYETLRSEKHTLEIQYARRSDRMPEPASEVKHHPSSVNLVVVKQLIDETRQTTLLGFLTKEFSSISPSLAKRLIDELGAGFDAKMPLSSLTDKQQVRLVALFKEIEFPPPDGRCLSPVGEYNLRLGIMKELAPDFLATHQETCQVHEGHPFIVEAGVCIGGADAKPGITVYRFANRIPLLFESGADVATRTANRRVNWSSYKVAHKTDKVGVFVSIVSTRIPFKGTGKEYIGDDIEPLRAAVGKAIKACARQLKVKLAKKQQSRAQADRKKNLAKYVPDVSRAVSAVLTAMQQPTRRDGTPLHLASDVAAGLDALTAAHGGAVDEAVLRTKLLHHIERIDAQQALQHVQSTGLAGSERTPCFLPAHPDSEFDTRTLYSPLFALRLLQ